MPKQFLSNVFVGKLTECHNNWTNIGSKSIKSRYQHRLQKRQRMEGIGKYTYLNRQLSVDKNILLDEAICAMLFRFYNQSEIARKQF
jgi:hypothetical protein